MNSGMRRRKSVYLQALIAGLALLLGANTVAAQIRTVIVSPVPGDPVASGTALRKELAGISSPSATNRWLLKIEPGTYDVGGTSLVMRPYVDVEGSGIDATTIKGNGDASGFENATIAGAENTELRLLTVQAIGSTTSSVIAMANYNASPRLYRVKFVAQGQQVWGVRNVNAVPLIEECEVSVSATATGGYAYGLVFWGYSLPANRRSSILRSKVAVSGASHNYGVYLGYALSLTSIRDSRIDVSGGSTTQGLYATGTTGWSGTESLAVRDTEINSAGGSTASYGLRFEGGASIVPNIFGSMIWGHVAPTTYGIYTDSLTAPGGIQGSTITGFTKAVQFGGSISISSTFLQGGPTTAGGWLGCMGVWDENAVFYAQGCP
jgi:hypothetical protein